MSKCVLWIVLGILWIVAVPPFCGSISYLEIREMLHLCLVFCLILDKTLVQIVAVRFVFLVESLLFDIIHKHFSTSIVKVVQGFLFCCVQIGISKVKIRSS